MHRIEDQSVREKIKEAKRTRSVAALANPYSLYSVDELIDNLETHEAQEGIRKRESPSIPEPIYDGYNIFRDNFRKIKDLEEYSALEKQMKEALARAQLDVYE